MNFQPGSFASRLPTRVCCFLASSFVTLAFGAESRTPSRTAGRIIEVVSGQPYAQFLDQRLFGPLGMVDTTFWPNAAQMAEGNSLQHGGAYKTHMQVNRANQLVLILLMQHKNFPNQAKAKAIIPTFQKTALDAWSAGLARVELKGFDADHRVDDVAFQDVVVNGRPLAREDVTTNAFVGNVTVQP